MKDKKKTSVTFFGGDDDLVSRVKLNAEQYDKRAAVVVGSHLVAYLEKGGILQDTFQPGTYPLFDKKAGVMRRVLGDIDGLEIVYVAKEHKEDMLWGTTSPIEMKDPVTEEFINVTANGKFQIRISDPEKFYREMVKHQSKFTVVDLQRKLLDYLMFRMKPAFAKTIIENRYTFDVIDMHVEELGNSLMPKLKKIFLDDYGIEMTDFIINRIAIPQNQKDEIKRILKQMKAEEIERKLKGEAKVELKEALAELERLADKEWEKEKYLLELKARDYDRYLEVCKAIGWESSPNPKAPASAGKFCPKCGKALTGGADFCNYCGAQVAGKKACSCGRENPPDGRFCGGCGRKL